jgi:hypothetical protein
MSFNFPSVSAGSPSTPKHKYNRSQFTQPSTTPAGPPPSWLTDKSTTPAGNPPPYGSSFNAAQNTFGKRGGTPARRGFAVPESSPPFVEADEEDEDAEGEEDDEMEHVPRGRMPAQTQSSAFMSSFMSSPRGLKRSRNGQVRGQVREQVESDYPAIAKGITARGGSAALNEPDDAILQQEDVLAQLNRLAEDQPHERELGVTERAAEVSKIWQTHGDTTTKEAGIGPESQDGFSKAGYLSSLLLQLRHPHFSRQGQPSRNAKAIARRTQADHTTIPRALLNWLDTYHNPFPDDFDALWRTQPSATAHDRFWDSIFACLVRGRFDRVVKLLKEAKWEYAQSAIDDLQDDDARYSERHIDSILTVVRQCVSLLQTSPPLKYDDWDIKGGDWTIFRQRVRHALKELETFAGEDEEDDGPLHWKQNVFGSSLGLSAASRKAESKVPWTIYENLKLTYAILLGQNEEIVDVSQDWLEASIYLTVWWDGQDDSAADLSKSQSLRKSNQKTREVDVTPSAAYRKRFANAFMFVTENDDPLFTPQTMDPLHVGLACVMVDSIESVIGLLKTWSVAVTSAVVEIAALAGWLPQAGRRSRGLLEQGFSSEDLMLLSHGPAGQKGAQAGTIDRDEILGEYADLLAGKDVLTSSDGRREVEGWEFALAVLGRLYDHSVSERKTAALLDRIELTDESRVDKVLAACNAQGLAEQARSMAEVCSCSHSSEIQTKLIETTAPRRCTRRVHQSVRLRTHILCPCTRNRQTQGHTRIAQLHVLAPLSRSADQRELGPATLFSSQRRADGACRPRARRSRGCGNLSVTRQWICNSPSLLRAQGPRDQRSSIWTLSQIAGEKA